MSSKQSHSLLHSSMLPMLLEHRFLSSVRQLFLLHRLEEPFQRLSIHSCLLLQHVPMNPDPSCICALPANLPGILADPLGYGDLEAVCFCAACYFLNGCVHAANAPIT